MTVAVVQLRC